MKKDNDGFPAAVYVAQASVTPDYYTMEVYGFGYSREAAMANLRDAVSLSDGDVVGDIKVVEYKRADCLALGLI